MTPSRQERLQHRMKQLKSAIDHISSVRQILRKNSQEIKSKIHSNIGRQLEALRNREVCLLNQVDIQHGAKDELLRNQQARLDTALGSVCKTQEIIAEYDTKVGDSDDGINDESLKPEAMLHIAFYANSIGLTDAIMRYGKIETTSFPDLSVFTRKHESSCLPKAFEESDDNDDSGMITKSFPRRPWSVSLPGSFKHSTSRTSSTSPLDLTSSWLASTHSGSTSKPRAKSFHKAIANSSKDTLKQSKDDLSVWLRSSPADGLRHVASDASICSWLYQLKTSPHMEEDEYETMPSSNRSVSGLETLSSPAKSASAVLHSIQLPRQNYHDVNVPIKALLAQDSNLWLHRTSVTSTETTSTCSEPRLSSNVGKYHMHLASQNNSRWITYPLPQEFSSEDQCAEVPLNTVCALRHDVSCIMQSSKFNPPVINEAKCRFSDSAASTIHSAVRKLQSSSSDLVWLQLAAEQSDASIEEPQDTHAKSNCREVWQKVCNIREFSDDEQDAGLQSADVDSRTEVSRNSPLPQPDTGINLHDDLVPSLNNGDFWSKEGRISSISKQLPLDTNQPSVIDGIVTLGKLSQFHKSCYWLQNYDMKNTNTMPYADIPSGLPGDSNSGYILEPGYMPLDIDDVPIDCSISQCSPSSIEVIDDIDIAGYEQWLLLQSDNINRPTASATMRSIQSTSNIVWLLHP